MMHGPEKSDLKDLALDQFTNRPGVTRIETSIIFRTTMALTHQGLAAQRLATPCAIGILCRFW